MKKESTTSVRKLYSKMMALWVMFFAMFLLPLTSAVPVPKGTNCWAYRYKYGPVCSSDTSSIPRPGATLQYQITVSESSKICCMAYTCSRYRCYMKNIGCGKYTWSSPDLPWEGGNTLATPKMQCKALSRWSVRYSYTTTH